jgi:thymidylate synthase
VKTFTFRNGVDSLYGLAEHLLRHGHKVAPRGQVTLEERNAVIQVTHPDDVTMYGIGRNWSDRLAAAEALQLIGGFSDPAAMVRMVPSMENFVNPQTRKFDGAYGPRTVGQMQAMLTKLLDDRDSRQGVLQVWNYTYDQIPGSVDYPCTVYINFAIRDSSLFMTTHMRSNDIWWGWCYDLFQFTQLGWTVANYLGLEMGTYTHVADSLHLYERDLPKLEKLSRPINATPQRLRGIGLKQSALQIPTWREFAQEPAWEFFYDIENTPLSDTEQWFIDRKIFEFNT